MVQHQTTADERLKLARYAHDTLQPVLDALPGKSDKVFAYLHIGMSCHPNYGGLSIWIHSIGINMDSVIDYASIDVTKASVNAIAERLPAKWAEARNAVTA